MQESPHMIPPTPQASPIPLPCLTLGVLDMYPEWRWWKEHDSGERETQERRDQFDVGNVAEGQSGDVHPATSKSPQEPHLHTQIDMCPNDGVLPVYL